jgi:prepilin-type N-terminal cleavage/methylation domain-containing protein
MHRNQIRVRLGFSLIEMLVVLSVIVILVSITFPVFATLRERARRTTCTSNLKQIGSALMLYTDDYDGFYPSMALDMYDRRCLAALWRTPEGTLDSLPLLSDTLYPYVRTRKLFVCPSTISIRDNDLDGGACLVGTDEIRTWPITYIQRTELSISTVNIVSVSNPAAIDVLHCHGTFHGSRGPANRAMNVLFLDQHVQLIPREEFVRISNTSWQY